MFSAFTITLLKRKVSEVDFHSDATEETFRVPQSTFSEQFLKLSLFKHSNNLNNFFYYKEHGKIAWILKVLHGIIDSNKITFIRFLLSLFFCAYYFFRLYHLCSINAQCTLDNRKIFMKKLHLLYSALKHLCWHPYTFSWTYIWQLSALGITYCKNALATAWKPLATI